MSTKKPWIRNQIAPRAANKLEKTREVIVSQADLLPTIRVCLSPILSRPVVATSASNDRTLRRKAE